MSGGGVYTNNERRPRNYNSDQRWDKRNYSEQSRKRDEDKPQESAYKGHYYPVNFETDYRQPQLPESKGKGKSKRMPEPTIKAPSEEPFYSAHLHGDEFPDPQQLAAVCGKMLHMYATHNARGDEEPPNARFELRRVPQSKDEWALHLNIDPCIWFVQFMKNPGSSTGEPPVTTTTTSSSSSTPAAAKSSPTPSSAASVARAYINRVKDEHARSPHRHDAAGSLPQKMMRRPETMCDYATNCEYAMKRGCKKYHSPHTCAWHCNKLGGVQEPCGWTSQVKLQIGKPYTDDFFIMQVQSSKPFARDLILFPRPLPIIKNQDNVVVHFGRENVDKWPERNWKGHYTNQELVVMPYFWDAVQGRVKGLRHDSQDVNAVETIALNFGAWESKQSQDPYSIECHGHAHLILSQGAQARLVTDAKTKDAWAPLSGRCADPPHYAFDDALRLETQYVLGEEMGDFRNEVRADIDSLREEMRKDREDQNKKLDSIMKALKISPDA